MSQIRACGREMMSGYLLRMVAWTGGVQAVLALSQSMFVAEAQSMRTAAIGTIGTANGCGTMLALGVVAATALAVEHEARRRVAYVSLAAVCATGLLANGSRGALFALLASGAVVGIAVARARGVVRLRSAVPVVVVALALLMIALARIDMGSSSGGVRR